CRRLRDSSAELKIYFFERPLRSGPISDPTFVAITTLSRLPLLFCHLPMIVSDSPPSFPGAQREYESAVSMRLKPASTKESSSRKEAGSSAVQPKTFPPNASGATVIPEFPSLRISAMELKLPSLSHECNQAS